MLAARLRSLVHKPQKTVRVQRRSITGKVYTDVDAAVADVKDGQTLYVHEVLWHWIRRTDGAARAMEGRKSALEVDNFTTQRTTQTPKGSLVLGDRLAHCPTPLSSLFALDCRLTHLIS